MRQVLLLAIASLPLAACRGVDPAPEDLDALMHYLWERFEEGEDLEIHEGVVNLHDAVDGATLEDAWDGALTPLTPEQAALVGVDDRDPADAPGFVLVHPILCDLDHLDDILAHPDQDELYTGVYDAYQRTWTSDWDAYADGEVDILTWDLEYEASVLGSSYTGTAKGMLRRVRGIDEEVSPFGTVLLARAHMPVPVAFERGNKSMDQDYQLEIYYDRADEEIVHTYGMWREADFGSGFTSESEVVQRLLLNGLEDWDHTTDDLCEDGVP
ncbi:MAG: hypothetical protein JRI25_25585 [Deltaproteobacteria bacterium]|nr:hypothetical protein [Deltaproteobacteria bacterium]